LQSYEQDHLLVVVAGHQHSLKMMHLLLLLLMMMMMLLMMKMKMMTRVQETMRFAKLIGDAHLCRYEEQSQEPL
jgi:uncharacterized membrane protein